MLPAVPGIARAPTASQRAVSIASKSAERRLALGRIAPVGGVVVVAQAQREGVGGAARQHHLVAGQPPRHLRQPHGARGAAGRIDRIGDRQLALARHGARRLGERLLERIGRVVGGLAHGPERTSRARASARAGGRSWRGCRGGIARRAPRRLDAVGVASVQSRQRPHRFEQAASRGRSARIRPAAGRSASRCGRRSRRARGCAAWSRASSARCRRPTGASALNRSGPRRETPDHQHRPLVTDAREQRADLLALRGIPSVTWAHRRCLLVNRATYDTSHGIDAIPVSIGDRPVTRQAPHRA